MTFYLIADASAICSRSLRHRPAGHDAV